MLKIIITDDEIAACELLEMMILRKFPTMQILAVCHDVITTVQAIQEYQPDVVFMDIQMPNHSGLELFDFLPKTDPIGFEIVFVTAHSDYAIQAFRLSAIDYLVKPLDILQLEETLNRLIHANKNKNLLKQIEMMKQNLLTKQSEQICVPTAEGKFFFSLQEIMYFEADGAYTHIHSTQKKLLVAKNLKFFEDLLSNQSTFKRIHRSYLLNLQFASQLIDSQIILTNETSLPVARDRMAIFKHLLP
ncbi:MAG: LytR/AlgR family response regulator transcription factor [Bacteroidia bacterium]